MTQQDDLKRANSVAQSGIGTYSTSIVSTSIRVTSAQQILKESSDSEREVKILTNNDEEIGS